jgi:hypothetical protein
MMPILDHTRWGIKPFLYGAYASSGGHWGCLGFKRSWVANWGTGKVDYSLDEFDLFGLVHLRREFDYWLWSFARLNLRAAFKSAGNCVFEARQKRQSRECLKRADAARYLEACKTP